ncbi:HAD superfamily, subfamily IIIB (Acid phosphatase) [compost metagenome]
MDIARRKAVLAAMQFLDTFSFKDGVENYSAVFDIDDTLIDSYTKNVIEPVLELYQYCINIGMPVFIITARDIKYQGFTERQLIKKGIRGYERMYMIDYKRIMNENVGLKFEDVMNKRGYIKSRYRLDIRDSYKYHVLLNVGDDDKDFEGDIFEVGVKLPHY